MIALITGASRGIGSEIALEFAKQGASVIINYRPSETSKIAAEQLLAKCNEFSQNNSIFGADVSNSDDVNSMFEFIKTQYGGVDAIVNNAGITKDKVLIAMSDDDFNSVLNINLNSVFYVTRAALKLMKKRGFKMVNMSSVSGIMGNSGQANYSASKAALNALTKTVAKEYASRNVLANAIAPGFIQTDMTKNMNQDAYQEMVKNIPLKRAGQVSDVAKLAYFLVSENNQYITGQTIVIDGGMTIGL